MQRQPTKITLALALALVAATGACAPMEYQPTVTSDVFTTSALPMYMGSPESKLRSLVDRAPFDLNCPPEQMTYKQMGSSNSVGVIGCGNRATYQLIPGAGWIMNTTSDGAAPADQGQAAPAPAAEPALAEQPAP
jgi:hypothetical protein